MHVGGAEGQLNRSLMTRVMQVQPPDLIETKANGVS